MVGKLHVNPESAFRLDFHEINKGNFARKNLDDYISYSEEFITASDEPFYLQVNFPDAHDPWKKQVAGLPEFPISPEEVELMPYIGVDSPELRNSVADYCNCIMRLDTMVGCLLDMLKKTGKYENTVIVYIGDHGAHFLRGKISVQEGGTRIPMIVSYPQSAIKGMRYAGLTSTIDLFPTFMDFAGSLEEEKYEGRSLKNIIMKGETKPIRRYLFTEFNVHSNHNPYPQRTVRDKRYKLIWTPLAGIESTAHEYNVKFLMSPERFNEILSLSPGKIRHAYERMKTPPEYQLYDLREDPWEWNDLSENPKYAGILKRLQRELVKWQRRTDDPFIDKECAERFYNDVKRTGLNKETICYATYMAPDRKPNVIGTVLCEGSPVSGVAVSDGEVVVTTDNNGRYEMYSSKPCGYVFVSVPGGYEVPCDDIIPHHFGYLSEDADKTDTIDFQLNKVDNDRFTLFVTTDVHLSCDSTDRDLEQFHKWLKPELSAQIRKTEGNVYSLCLGDMSTDVKWHKKDGTSYTIKDYREEMKGLPCPVWHVPGNHDNERKGEATPEKWDSLAQSVYRQNIGPNYYSMNIGKWHFLMLDCVVALGPGERNGKRGYLYDYRFDDRQVLWMKRDLAMIDKNTPLIVCLHIPPYVYSGVENGRMTFKDAQPDISKVLMPLLSGFSNVMIFGGHYHRTQNIKISEEVTQHTFVSVSAVSWMLNGPHSRLVADDGTPGGYTIFEFDGENVRWQFKAEGYDIEKNQFRAYDLNEVPEEYGGQPGSDKVLLNVYNWDEKWSVEAFENGRKLEVRQIYSRDPLYLLIRESELPKRPTAFRGSFSAHFFEVTAHTSDNPLEIVITDRFGNVYRQTVKRPKSFSWQTD